MAPESRKNQHQNHDVWKDDRVQFSRLLGELYACGLTRDQYRFLEESAGLSQADVEELLVRADGVYEQVKEKLCDESVSQPERAVDETDDRDQSSCTNYTRDMNFDNHDFDSDPDWR